MVRQRPGKRQQGAPCMQSESLETWGFDAWAPTFEGCTSPGRREAPRHSWRGILSREDSYHADWPPAIHYYYYYYYYYYHYYHYYYYYYYYYHYYHYYRRRRKRQRQRQQPQQQQQQQQTATAATATLVVLMWGFYYTFTKRNFKTSIDIQQAPLNLTPNSRVYSEIIVGEITGKPQSVIRPISLLTLWMSEGLTQT